MRLWFRYCRRKWNRKYKTGAQSGSGGYAHKWRTTMDKLIIYGLIAVKSIVAAISLLCIFFMMDTTLVIIPCLFGGFCFFILHRYQKILENTVKEIHINGADVTFISCKNEMYTCKRSEIISVELNFTCTGYNFKLQSGKMHRTKTMLERLNSMLEKRITQTCSSRSLVSNKLSL